VPAALLREAQRQKGLTTVDVGVYVPPTGVLTIILATTSYRAHREGAAVGALIGGAASIGWMAVVNFMVDSDFKWFGMEGRLHAPLTIGGSPHGPGHRKRHVGITGGVCSCPGSRHSYAIV
jgi:hypothetical protein